MKHRGDKTSCTPSLTRVAAATYRECRLRLPRRQLLLPPLSSAPPRLPPRGVPLRAPRFRARGRSRSGASTLHCAILIRHFAVNVANRRDRRRHAPSAPGALERRFSLPGTLCTRPLPPRACNLVVSFVLLEAHHLTALCVCVCVCVFV